MARSKDDPKKWTAFWHDPDGKQRQKSFDTKERADDHRRRKEQELDAGTYLDDRLGKQPVTAVWEQWMSQRKLTNSTKKQYRSILNTTIEPFFKARSIVSLKVADIEQWMLWMEHDRKLSTRTPASALLVLLRDDGLGRDQRGHRAQPVQEDQACGKSR
nr:phage integrase N-terminal SAM-like domain-containing protein [Streptomyces sp. CZ24]